jgi:predicted nucleic acid-binding protein
MTRSNSARRLVVDANILFAALIKDSITAHLLVSDAFELYAPSYLLAELAKHEATILEKTHRSRKEFDLILDAYRERITFVDRTAYAPFLDVELPDPNDADYVALARFLDSPIWSNDAELKEQGVVIVLSTRELLGSAAASAGLA